MTIEHPLVALALALALSATLAAPARADDDGCRRCDKRGVVACPEHDEEMLEFESHVQFCSVVAACPTCVGALLIDCKYCKGGPDSPKIAERQAAVAEWMRYDPMSAFLERPVPHVETKQFQLVVDTGPLKNGKKTFDGHKILLLVADDVEAVNTLVAEHFGKVSHPAQYTVRNPGRSS